MSTNPRSRHGARTVATTAALALGGALAAVATAAPGHASTSASTRPSSAAKASAATGGTAATLALTVDAVKLTVTGPDVPTTDLNQSVPGAAIQTATTQATSPFSSFSVTAVPYGKTLPKSAYPASAAGDTTAWRAAEGPSTAGPVASVFGHQVTGQVRHLQEGASAVESIQWVVENGGRTWVVRAQHAEGSIPAGYGTGLAITASNPTAATTVGSANRAASMMSTAAVTDTTPIVSFGGGPLPVPPASMWKRGGSNSTCDNFLSLLNERIAGLQVCGWSNGADASNGWGNNEWECAELPLRYAAQRYGLTSSDSGNGEDQADNLYAILNSKYGSGHFVLRGNSLSDHTPPEPGDIISYYNGGAGHTGVVLAAHTNSSGVVTSIDMVHQNWYQQNNGLGGGNIQGEWDGIAVNPDGTVYNVLGNGGDVHWEHNLADGATAPVTVNSFKVTSAIAGSTDGTSQVLATATSGVLYHEVRRADGTWTGFQPLLGGNGTPFVAKAAAIAGIPNGSGDSQVLAVGTDGTLYFDIRYGSTGNWSGFTPLTGGNGLAWITNSAPAIAGSTDGTSQVLAMSTSGVLYHELRRTDGTWTGFQPLLGGNGTPFVAKAASIAGIPDGSGNSQVLAVATDGTLYHNIRYGSSGGWQGFTAVTGGNGLAWITNSAPAIAGSTDGTSQVLAMSTTGVLYHELRRTDGTWTGFQPLLGGNGTPFVAKAAAIAGIPNGSGDAQILAVATDGTLYHNIRYGSSGGWQGFGALTGGNGSPWIVG